MSKVLNAEMEYADIIITRWGILKGANIDWRTSEIAFVSQALAPAH